MRLILLIVAVFGFSVSQASPAGHAGPVFETFRTQTMSTVKQAIVGLADERRMVRQAIRTLPPGPARVAAFKRQAELNVSIFKLQRKFYQAKNDRGTGAKFFLRLGRHLVFANNFVSPS